MNNDQLEGNLKVQSACGLLEATIESAVIAEDDLAELLKFHSNSSLYIGRHLMHHARQQIEADLEHFNAALLNPTLTENQRSKYKAGIETLKQQLLDCRIVSSKLDDMLTTTYHLTNDLDSLD